MPFAIWQRSPLASFAIALVASLLYLLLVIKLLPHAAHFVVLVVGCGVWQHLATRHVAMSAVRRWMQTVVSAVLAPYLAWSIVAFVWLLRGGQM
jgi:hypothetical protein